MQFNLADLHETISDTVAERTAMVHRAQRFSYADISDRSRRLANFLLTQGIKQPQARSSLANWQSGQDHIALYMFNGHEYLEGMLGAFKSRAVPFNVNYRYVAEELYYLLNNAQAKAIIYHSSFAPILQAVRDKLPQLQVLIQVPDASNNPLLPGAIDYEVALSTSSAERPDLEYSPDDLYMLYTGGTTGMPKGVLWRQGDILINALGGRKSDGSIIVDKTAFIERALHSRGFNFLTTPPYMHGASHWVAFNAWFGGNTVVLQDDVVTLNPADILATIERERCHILLLVGDAFGRPLLDAARSGRYDLSSIKNIMNSGAILTQPVKDGLLACIPQAKIVDTMGSSETGSQGQQLSTATSSGTNDRFTLSVDNAVLSEDLSSLLEPGHSGLGWLARRGHVPLGYLEDEDKSRKTFPEIDGQRYSVPGDRARLFEHEEIQLLGRDSATINTGGEKVFAEEVEQAIKFHPDVFDAVVTGRESERWGNEVIAIIQMRADKTFNRADVLAVCEKHIARFKFPRAFNIVEKLQRSPSGKADYRWAKEQSRDAK